MQVSCFEHQRPDLKIAADTTNLRHIIIPATMRTAAPIIAPTTAPANGPAIFELLKLMAQLL